MKLIATLPPVHQRDLFMQIMRHPLVDAVRYNTGIQSPFSVEETLEFIFRVARQCEKPVWIDLKGRQLRIKQWIDPYQGIIQLNHKITVDCPARIFLRGDDSLGITHVKEDTLYVDQPPRYALGAGQSVNVHGENLVIDGYLTEGDHEYLHHCCKFEHYNFMLSFVESMQDIWDVETVLLSKGVELNATKLVLKIESPLGVQLVKDDSELDLHGYTLMAARDDLFINTPEPKVKVLDALKDLATRDSEAMVASRIFAGIEQTGSATMADFADIRLMQSFGYKTFMLSDGLCARNFEPAIKAWGEFVEIYGGESND